MINTAKVSVRGQVAVPKSIREKLSIKEGDTLVFYEKNGEVIIRKVKDFFAFEGSLPAMKKSFNQIKDEAMEAMAKEAVDV